jgi:hypothetical protein
VDGFAIFDLILPDFRHHIFLATSFIYSAAVTFWQKFLPPGISGLAKVGISSSSMEGMPENLRGKPSMAENKN